MPNMYLTILVLLASGSLVFEHGSVVFLSTRGNEQKQTHKEEKKKKTYLTILKKPILFHFSI